MKTGIVIALIFAVLGAGAQTQSTKNPSVTIRGTVILADENTPAIGAVVKLNAADSAKLTRRGRVVASGADGKFTIYSTEKKSDITIEYTGYKPKKVEIPAGKSVVDLGSINLFVEPFNIGSVVVAGKASMSKVVGDTVQFNAAAFKTNPDATTEDLLKKMPGVTTDESGNVQSQGQSIGKVYVNGKEYFDDPSLALKSLPQDAVESIQMYDDKSDQAKFSGFDDGERVRAINIVTKKGVMNSTFGKAYVGYGTDGRYSAGVGVNTFTDKHRFTITAQANNVNNQGFTLSDIASGSGRGGGRGRFSSGGNDLAGFSTTSRGGITQSVMAGVNYTGELSKKFKLTGSYFFSWRQADVWNLRSQDYLTTPRNYNSSDTSMGYETSHNLRLRSEWNPNENNRIIFNPSLNYTLNYGNSINRSTTLMEGALSNGAINNYGTNLARMDGSADLWWQHRFAKAGRTMSIGGVIGGRKDMGRRNQYSIYESLSDDGLLTPETLKQIADVTSSGYNFTASATYTEPISKSSRLSANYSISYDKTITNKDGFNWDEAVQDYIARDTTTTNYINRNYTTHLAGIGYSLVKDKMINLSAGVNYQNATLNNKQITLTKDEPVKTSTAFEAVLPSLRLSLTPKKGHNLNIDYNTSSIFPSVTQLQDMINTDNPLQVSKGNANLKQSYSHRLFLRYNFSDTEKNLNLNIFGSATATSDYIATHRRFLAADTVVNSTVIVRGAQYSEPVNLQGYFNASLFTTFGFGIKPIKSNVNITAHYRYSRTPSMQDYTSYISDVNSFGGNISLTSNISENIDFTLSYRPRVNLSQGGAGNFDRYFSHDASAFINVIFLKHFFVNADASWRNTFGTQASYSQHYALINGAIGAKFLKNNSAEVRLSVYDALGQNRSLWQSTTDTYTQISQSQVLQQYFMLSFTYKFDTRKGAARGTNDAPAERQRGMGGMRMH